MRLTSAFVVLSLLAYAATGTSLTDKMRELEDHYAHLRTLARVGEQVAQSAPMAPNTRADFDKTLLAMAKIAQELQTPALSRGQTFTQHARTFQREIEGLRKRLPHATLQQAQGLVSETALTCGNCHGCRAND